MLGKAVEAGVKPPFSTKFSTESKKLFFSTWFFTEKENFFSATLCCGELCYTIPDRCGLFSSDDKASLQLV